MKKHLFIAIMFIRTEENGEHLMIGTGANGEHLFSFELSREVANQLSEKMELQIVNVKKQKTWQEDQENAEAVNAVALQ